jgi:hypothetical protein
MALLVSAADGTPITDPHAGSPRARPTGCVDMDPVRITHGPGLEAAT